jgi:GMP synthase-like glutamine amidotransferase
MRVHVLRHVEFEGPAMIAEWAAERGHSLSESMASDGDLPATGDVDLLVVMGGPMAADDLEGNPWLEPEIACIRDAIDGGRLVLGICLGAQLIAAAAGGSVRRNAYREIGWYPVRRTAASARDPLFAAFPDVLVVGHWHGDTFELPDGIEPLLSSDACANQAFSLADGRVVGLQFHLEWTVEALESLVDACIDELSVSSPYVTTAAEMLSHAERHVASCRAALWMLLDLMVSLAEEKR